MYGCMDGSMNGWMYGCMDGGMYGWMHGCMNGCMDVITQISYARPVVATGVVNPAAHWSLAMQLVPSPELIIIS